MTLHRKYVVTIADQSGETPDAFVVVVNDLGQHALWQAELDVPRGWRRHSPVMSKSQCLGAVEGSWKDIAPLTARAAPGGGGGMFVHERFADQAARRPDANAIVAGRTRMTYRELDESASRLAHHLAAAGVGPETVTGVHLERGVDLITAILAIMKAGGGYLPLDPTLPGERLARICDQVSPLAVITDERTAWQGAWPRLVPLGELAADLADRPVTWAGTRPRPDNLCYVIYTSGSTGDPKAVAVSFGSMACVIGEMAREYHISEDDRVGQVAAMAFDTFLEQVFTALTAGASLTLPPHGTMAPSELLRGIERKQVTVLDLTPAYWHQVLALTHPADERLRSVRLMITGGEMADPADCRAALRAAPWARLLNAYGLTETTITSAVFDIGAWLPTAEPHAAVPVGRPSGHARIMVLDGELNPVPAGTAGEIYIGGCGVARGYLGRPALTAERFLPDARGVPGGRMYRTGDLGRWLADGSLEVAGRVDRQLKVRGFRVEPGEIESVLAGHPDIDQVSVVASTRGSGDTRLVAYYTPSAAAAAETGLHHPPAASLRHYLLDRLPGYMVPAAFIPRHHLPPGAGQGPDGQDWQDGQDGHSHGHARGPGERHTPTQAGLSALWARLLGKDHVGLDDDFFALGGNSLLAAEMLAHTRAIFGISADSVRPLTRCLLRDPTLRGFSAAAADARAGRLAADSDQAEVDFARETRLNLKIRLDGAPSYPRPDWRSPREVLLTGATGFLGAHLLSELLATTDARVHCLVRARDDAAALSRIRQAANRYELAVPSADRVVPLVGDLAEPRLGLSDTAFRDLAHRIDVIYHAGALVNFIYPYQELRAANVTGTREVIRLAGLHRGIPVHYVSTTAVLAGLGVAGTREVTEETPLADPELLGMGYVETKYVAEEVLRAAGRAGLPVAIYRPLDIVGSVHTGAWSTSTEMAALIRFIADTGLAPDIDLPLDFVAADVCAAAIGHISVTEGATGRTYHLASTENAPLGVLVARLRTSGYQIAELPFDEWVRELARQAARDPSHPMAAFLPLFVDRGAAGLTVAEMYLKHIFPSYTRTNTERALRGSGIAFPPVSGQLLDSNIDRLMRTGYLPAPLASHPQAHVG
jgi:amino acid adenylation domain-containing protein/thioester reductase-like protein